MRVERRRRAWRSEGKRRRRERRKGETRRRSSDGWVNEVELGEC